MAAVSSGLQCIAMATLLPLLLLSTCSGHTILYVKPTPDTSCPADPCLTLSQYAQQPHHYLISNTTLLLLPGDHVLSVNFTVENVSDFEIHAAQLSSPSENQTVNIVCQELVGLAFENVLCLSLYGLTFNLCGRGTYTDYVPMYGVKLYFGRDTQIANCSFQNSIGTALGVFNSSLDLRGSNSFTNNCGKCSGNLCFCLQSGGGIYTTASTLVFTGNSTFRGNTAELGGGIFAYNSTLNFRGDSIFSDNSAGSGGGIEALYCILNFPGNISFSNNSAEYGGGIDTQNSILKFTGGTFTNNLTEYQSGEVLTVYSSLVHTGSCAFSNNSANVGGGINTVYSTLVFTGKNTFIDNSVEEDGGGINSWNSILEFTGSNTFRNNLAERDGGGINALNSILEFTGNNTFRNNLAERAGGGTAAGNSTLNFTGNNAFRNNSAERDCGGIIALYSTLNFTGSITIRGNSAGGNGGGMCALHSTMIFTGNSIFIENSVEYDGGGIYVSYGTLKFTSNSIFRNNSAESDGGGIAAVYSTLKFTGNSTFSNNSAERSGGGINARYSTLNFAGNSTIRGNSAGDSGGGMYALCSTLIFTGNSIFNENSVEHDGGGIYVWYGTLNFTSNSTFRNNSAERNGGGTYALCSTLNFTGISSFKHNTARNLGGGICATLETILKFTGNSNFGYSGDCNSCNLVFMDNSALVHGGAVYTQDSTLSCEGFNNIIFSGNSAWYYGGGVYSENSTLTFSGNTDFRSNSGRLQGGGIYGLGTSFYFSGSSIFTANTAARGGGEYLADSFNFLSKNATFTMDSNNATGYGGAVYVEDSDPVSYCLPDMSHETLKRCFFQLHGSVENIPIIVGPSLLFSVYRYINAYFNIQINMYNNDAQIAGSAVYGGSLENCFSQVHFSFAENEGIIPVDMFAYLEPIGSISSDPFQVCTCEDGIPNCNTSELVRQVYPGELLHFPVVAAGQREGIVPAIVRAFFTDKNKNTSLAQYQDTQHVKKDCTDLHYQIQSSVTNSSDTLVLYADGSCSTDGRLLNISLQFLPCPPGFSNSFERICGCEPRLQKYTTRCNITEREITREGAYWVGYDNNSQALILHPHCPFDYCKPVTDHTNFALNNTDLQCANSRSGFLCGQCRPRFSLVLGNSKCLHCSNLNIWLLIPFALAGIALVLLLLIFKLTVAAGTINGLIFYANIVTVNRAIFFPPNQTNILTVFIAWLNLDLGIEICFFDGMDAYIKTWLQLIFPLYIWSLVGLIIIVSDYSSNIARLFGSNPVAVLATLFLLSYAKLLRTIISALFFTFLDYPNEVQVAVWLYDGNIKYLHGKHIILFLVALLILLILFLPYTLLLTVGQWLQAKSNRRLFYWINKPRIKPFLDAYQAPYRDQHRYWTGLMLCLRCALFLVFAFNTQADPSLNLLAIGAVVIGLLTLTHFTGLIYKKMYLDILEISYILNLGILAVATYYVKFAVVPVSQVALVSVSVGVALTTFVGVLLFHIYQQVWPKLLQRIHQLHHEERERSDEIGTTCTMDHEAHPLIAPTMSVIERPNQEPLTVVGMDDSNAKAVPAKTFTELREPLDLI